jgi:hypothetical protein
MRVNLLGTLCYTLAEVSITVLADILPRYVPIFGGTHPSAITTTIMTEKKSGQLGESSAASTACSHCSVISAMVQNKNGVLLVLLYHWVYIIAADVYIQCKIPWMFHFSHFLNLCAVPVVVPLARYLFTLRQSPPKNTKKN